MEKYTIILDFYENRPHNYNFFQRGKIYKLKEYLKIFDVLIKDDNLGEDVDDYHLYIETNLKLTQIQILVLLTLGENRQEYVDWAVVSD